MVEHFPTWGLDRGGYLPGLVAEEVLRGIYTHYLTNFAFQAQLKTDFSHR